MTPATLKEEAIADVIARLEAELSALGSAEDVLLTYAAQAEYARVQSWLMGRLRTIRTSTATLTEVEPQIAALEKWRADEIDRREPCLSKLATLDPKDPKRYGWELSLRRIDRGLDLQNEMYPARLPLDDLMAAAGYVPADPVARAAGDAWYGSLPQVEHRLRELTAKRDDAQDRIDRVLAEFDARRDMQQTS
jgi:hypothetical protein